MSGNAMVSIKDLDKAAVFAALYNRARPLGSGIVHYKHGDMTPEQAREEMRVGDDLHRMFGKDDIRGDETRLFFDYVRGRVMKVDITGDEFDPWGYDRDNGEGAAAEAIEQLRKDTHVAQSN